ncbi:hypothetical protein KFK09_010586 [Dendrobium nobile]|uniref:Uncharacterized protein n=1 Tax=Dendrobium nobile TaxID=94219 RepID=A0A8T3BAF0_DENNO|nr:hypothetical protein KFK09_010586 [Dendrobium nobile]
MESKLFPCPLISNFILIILLSAAFTGSSYSRIISEEEKSWRGGDSSSSSSSSARYNFNISPCKALDDRGSIYGVSGRTVPEGPNPLHN